MSPADLFHTEDAIRLTEGLERLPVYVRPLPQEALVSWAWRLTSGLRWNSEVLLHDEFGLPEPINPHWWVRPEDALLNAIAARTGVERASLRRMTFLDWAPPAWDDEAMERFDSWRYYALVPVERRRGLAVCTECLRGDEVPYLRMTWLIGWVAICEEHGCTLLTRCPECRRSLRIPKPGSMVAYVASRCGRCGANLSSMDGYPTPESLSELHARLLVGKRTGATNLPGIGSIAWAELVMLIDVLMRTVWAQMEDREALAFFAQVAQARNSHIRHEAMFLMDRCGSLSLITWLLEDWPNNLRASEVPRLAMDWLRDFGRRRPFRIGARREEVWESRVPELLAMACDGVRDEQSPMYYPGQPHDVPRYALC